MKILETSTPSNPVAPVTQAKRIRRSCGMEIIRGRGSRYMLLLFLGGLAVLCHSASATTTVSMLSKLSSQMQQTNKILQSWSEKNQQSAEDLYTLTEENTKKAEEGMERPSVETWSKVEELNLSSLGVLHATASLWKEFGAASSCTASSIENQAWQDCLEDNGGECTFREMLARMDEKSLEIAIKAAANAQDMTESLELNIEKLQELSSEARDADGLGAGLDTLSKVNASAAASLVTLSNQINSMLSFTLSEAESEHQRRLTQDENTAALTEAGDEASSPHLSVSISEHVY